MAIFQFLQSLQYPVHLFIFLLFIVLLLAALVLAFLILFIKPSRKSQRNLSRINKILNVLRDEAKSSDRFVDPAIIQEKAMQDRLYKHLWDEYSETLHPQKSMVGEEEIIIGYRSTVRAEAFFNTETLVDIPLRTDFFKHLPGIFTGLGIIGTFYGLITCEISSRCLHLSGKRDGNAERRTIPRKTKSSYGSSRPF